MFTEACLATLHALSTTPPFNGQMIITTLAYHAGNIKYNKVKVI
jgi:hypothetical protein